MAFVDWLTFDCKFLQKGDGYFEWWFVPQFLWLMMGFLAWITAGFCAAARSGSKGQKLFGILLAIAAGPFYFVYVYFAKSYCR